jgi:hypothetical protein
VDATVRLYGRGLPGERTVTMLMSASRYAEKPLGFTLRGDRQLRAGSVDPGGARPPVQVGVCVPAQGHVDVTLRSSGQVQIPDGRRVALHVDQIWLTAGGRCSAGQVSSR